MNKQLLAAMHYLAKVRPKKYRLTKWVFERKYNGYGPFWYVVGLQERDYDMYGIKVWTTIYEVKIEAKL